MNKTLGNSRGTIKKMGRRIVVSQFQLGKIDNEYRASFAREEISEEEITQDKVARLLSQSAGTPFFTNGPPDTNVSNGIC